MKTDTKEKCFVIMPISDPEGYNEGHFKCVYEDILKPAIENAGYEAFRVDEKKSSNMIQVSIIDEIISAPMAICDLSTRNPNVLFELGIRQAFDLPVVLVQEENTPRIFDIANINTIDYRNGLIYREVMEDRDKITEGINSTREDKNGINSIIKLLQVGKKAEINSATMTENDEIKLWLVTLSNELKRINDKMTSIDKTQELAANYTKKRISESESYLHTIRNIDKIEQLRYRGEIKRLHEIAKELDVSNSELIDILKSNNYDVSSHMSALDERALDIIRNHYKYKAR